jgi:methyl-accepting chemotaxis protein
VILAIDSLTDMLKLFHNQTPAVKMMGGLVITAVITLATGWARASQIQAESSGIEKLYQRHLRGISDLEEAHVQLLRALSGQKNALLTDAPEQRYAGRRQMRESERAFADLVEIVGKDLSGSRENSLYAAIERPWDSFRSTSRQIEERLLSGQTGQAVQLSIGMSLEAFSATQRALEEFVEYRKRDSAREYQESLGSSQQARLWLCGLSILGSVLGLGTGYFIASVVANPTRQIVIVLQDLEHGDLMRTLSAYSGDEASAPVKEETVAATNEMDRSAERTASLATSMAGRIVKDRASGANAQSLAEQMAQPGAAIDVSSQRIAKVAQAMDEIALQTNLLALNAALQAAYAGEQGTGPVVMVQRSDPRSAALSDSVKHVDAG